MRCDIGSVLTELSQAINARFMYEGNPDLTVEDLFYIGGRLKSLISRSEQALLLMPSDWSPTVRRQFTGYLDETRSFSKYIRNQLKERCARFAVHTN